MTVAGRRRPIRKPIPAALRGALVLVTLTLAACGGMTSAPPQAGPTAVQASPAGAAEAPRDFSALPQPAPRPERTYPEPAALRGLDGGALSGLLGQPKFKRRDDPAEIWQYRTDNCALDFFLYRSKEDLAYRVRHVEARGRGQAPASAKDCLVALMKAREQGGQG